jgi:hypothetical protein
MTENDKRALVNNEHDLAAGGPDGAGKERKAVEPAGGYFMRRWISQPDTFYPFSPRKIVIPIP